MRSAIGIMALLLALPCSAEETAKTVLEVQAERTAAIKALREKGIKAVELDNSKFVLPTVRISGNEAPYEVGDEVILDVSVDRSKLPDGLTKLKFNWVVIDGGKRRRFITSDDGQQIGFGTGKTPRKITVILDINCLFEVKDDKGALVEVSMDSPDPYITEVVVGTPTPTPPGPTPPGPTPPGPSPAPDFPAGQFGLAKFTYDTLTADAALKPEEKVKLAQALSSSFGGIAAKIAAVATYNDLATILADTSKANGAAIASSGVPLAATAAFKRALGDKIYSLYHDQAKISTGADLGVAYREIKAGLDAIVNK